MSAGLSPFEVWGRDEEVNINNKFPQREPQATNLTAQSE